MKTEHNCSLAERRESSEANGLHTELYLFVVYEVIITSNLYDNIELNDVDKSAVVDFIYEDESGTRSGNLPESVVVQFRELYYDIELFIS